MKKEIPEFVRNAKECKEIPIDEIRKDLYDIRYYYAHKSLFDKAGLAIVKNTILEKTAKYNSIMEKANPRMYALYVALYTENNTQIVVAEDWNVSEGYVKYLNKRLLLFLQKELNGEGGKKQ